MKKYIKPVTVSLVLDMSDMIAQSVGVSNEYVDGGMARSPRMDRGWGNDFKNGGGFSNDEIDY